MARMTKRERCIAAVNCQPVDRVPVGFWYHFRLDHSSAEPLAEAELAFAKKYDPDFLKVMHDLKLDLPDGMTEITDPNDWYKLKPLDPRTGNFAEQLKALQAIKRGLTKDMPVIDTIFNPYASANKLCGKKLMQHLRTNPDAVKHALQAISVSLSDYAAAWMQEGGDGVYYALDGAQTTNMTESEYREVFMPYDRIVLNSLMEQGTFNMLHIHGESIMFDMLHDLPSHVLVWSDKLTPPSLSEGRGKHQGCIAGGINEMTFHEKSPSEVIAEAQSAIAEAGSVGFILTPGCAISTDSPDENILALRQSVEG